MDDTSESTTRKATAKMFGRTATVFQYECCRCGHKWNPRKPGVPVRCAGSTCKTPYWNVPKKDAAVPETAEFEEVR